MMPLGPITNIRRETVDAPSGRPCRDDQSGTSQGHTHEIDLSGQITTRPPPRSPTRATPLGWRGRITSTDQHVGYARHDSPGLLLPVLRSGWREYACHRHIGHAGDAIGQDGCRRGSGSAGAAGSSARDHELLRRLMSEGKGHLLRTDDNGHLKLVQLEATERSVCRGSIRHSTRRYFSRTVT